jgi:hypothetical protein
MTLTTLHLLADEPPAIAAQLEVQEANALPGTHQPIGADWVPLPEEFQPLSFREQLRLLFHH